VVPQDSQIYGRKFPKRKKKSAADLIQILHMITIEIVINSTGVMGICVAISCWYCIAFEVMLLFLVMIQFSICLMCKLHNVDVCVDDDDDETTTNSESVVSKSHLSELCSEAAKLKSMGVMNQVLSINSKPLPYRFVFSRTY